MEDCRKKFAKVYDQYIDKIYRFVFLKVASRETAEDLCSETFLRGWQAFQSQNEIRNLPAFLYTTARNLVVDYYRQKGREPRILAEYAAADFVDPKQDLTEAVLLGSDLETLKRALFDMSGDYQDVIIWHYLDGLSFNEIADLMGRTKGAVRVLLHRALADLRGKLPEV